RGRRVWSRAGGGGSDQGVERGKQQVVQNRGLPGFKCVYVTGRLDLCPVIKQLLETGRKEQVLHVGAEIGRSNGSRGAMCRCCLGRQDRSMFPQEQLGVR